MSGEPADVHDPPPAPPTPHVVRASDRIRWRDVDPAGIIRYDTYVRLLEIGETELFRAAGLPFSIDEGRLDVFLPRRRLAFEYQSPARLDDVIEVRAGVERVGETSLTLGFEFADAATGARRATAEMVVVCVDRRTLAKRPVPQAVRDAVAPFVRAGRSAEDARPA